MNSAVGRSILQNGTEKHCDRTEIELMNDRRDKPSVAYEGLTARLLIARGEEVLVACAPSQAGKNGKQERREAEIGLALTLWNRFPGRRPPSRVQTEGDSAGISIIRDALGKPEFRVRGSRAASVSFSHGVGTTWAALCRGDVSLGVDVAEPEEFTGQYPFNRVFHETEWETAWTCPMGAASAGGLPPKTHFPCPELPHIAPPFLAAFLWSVKEAVVKALGCGFHLVDPLDVRISVGSIMGDMILSCARLVGKAREHFPMAGRTLASIVSIRHGCLWVSVAVIPGVIAME